MQIRKHFKYLLVSCFMLVMFVPVWAQQGEITKPTDAQLAMEYYRKGDYNKAVQLYEVLYYTNRSVSYYRLYLNCLIQLETYKKAEDMVKDQLKSNKMDLTYYVDLGYVQNLQGYENRAKTSYNNAIKKLRKDQFMIIRVANAFMGKRLYDYAEETYRQGRKLLAGAYGFEMELAQLYYYKRDFPKMLDSYLDILLVSDRYLQQVQNRLQQAVYNDVDENLHSLLNDKLLERINKYPEVSVYNELLIWLYVQQKNFQGAFIQARALDLRLNENGSRLVSLARLATSNNDFDVAIQAYQYVIDKGELLEYFFAAQNELLEVMFTRITLGIDNDKQDFLRLEESYSRALQQLGFTAQTADMVANLAHLKAFYLDKTTEAWFMLEEAMEIPKLTFEAKGKLELELADIYLVSGKMWDATFAYTRVEENNKNNPTGYEAKFRKARLAYFMGEFDWSMAQLDILKASTSKLVANDAAKLSLFIYDNTGWDSTDNALKHYVRADLLRFQHKDSLAILSIDSLIDIHGNHVVVDEALFLKAGLLEKHGKDHLAIPVYQQIIDNYYYEILADDALFFLAGLYEKSPAHKTKAMGLYLQILQEFSDSIYTYESRKRLRLLRGDKLLN